MVATDLSALVQTVGHAVAWAPGWLVGSLLLAALAAATAAAHGWLLRVLGRWAGGPATFAGRLIAALRGPSLLAAILLILALALPLANLPAAASLMRLGLLGIVLLSGWSAIMAVRLTAELYERRLPATAADDVAPRAHLTQVRVLSRAATVVIGLITLAAALMTIPPVRQFGLSLFASASVAGVVAGLAARPLLANLIAGIQIALTQPIRLNDAVVVEGEQGAVEEITTSYVVLRLWDERRMIVPLSYFIEKPFQNWTHGSSSLIGTVLLYVDWSVPVARLRMKLEEVVRACPLWDGRTLALQVTDVTKQGLVELRAVVSAGNSSRVWDLRCHVREALVAFLQQEYPHALPAVRLEPGAPAPLVPDRSAN